MDLRAKLAIVFLGILALPLLAVSSVQVDHTMATMVANLSDSGTLVADQVFEQIRFALGKAPNTSPADLASVLGKDPSLAALLSSSQAFGKGVVYARIANLDGRPIASAGSVTGSDAKPATINDLRTQVASWWPWTRIAALWNERTYEMIEPINANDNPFAEIQIGLSTALISTEAHRAVEEI